MTIRKKIFTGIIIFLCSLLVIYFGMALYFMSHFYFGTEVNGINISLSSVNKAEKQMMSELKSYQLKLKERGGKIEYIRGSEIGLNYTPENALNNFKDNQNPFAWVSAIFSHENLRMSIGILYGSNLLKEKIDRLSCFNSSNVIEPKNPSFKYTDNGYIVEDGSDGSKVNKDILYEHIVTALLKRQDEIDLDAIGCYTKPQYTVKSQKVLEVRDLLDKYISSKVTYTFEKANAIIDGSEINKWLAVDNNLTVTIDENKMKSYLSVLSNNYAQTGKITDFTTSSGKTININGGDYEWMINTNNEAQYLSTAIMEGKALTRKPTYIQKTAYVEIDLTKQHLWFYKSGSLVAQGDIVSGNTSLNRGTPEGIYSLKYKKMNAVLKGPDYASPVDYWMPFTGGIGMHDASWRHRFGGNIYKTDGSHGCVNCPYSLAKKIFENIQVGTPVICYY